MTLLMLSNTKLTCAEHDRCSAQPGGRCDLVSGLDERVLKPHKDSVGLCAATVVVQVRPFIASKVCASLFGRDGAVILIAKPSSSNRISSPEKQIFHPFRNNPCTPPYSASLGLLQQPHHGRERARDRPQKEEKGRRMG